MNHQLKSLLSEIPPVWFVGYIIFCVLLIVGLQRGPIICTFPEKYYDSIGVEKQPDGITCGPTSALMVLRAYGKNVTLEQVKRASNTQWFEYHGKPIGMTSPDCLPMALSKYGVPAYLLVGNFDILRHYVSSGKPVIVLLRSGVTYWHYVVVVGYDRKDVIIADPGWGTERRMPINQFLGAWSFKMDMYGNAVVDACSTCGGTGYWMDKRYGPFAICEICNGRGEKIDYLSKLLSSAEVQPMTMIIPKSAINMGKY